MGATEPSQSTCGCQRLTAPEVVAVLNRHRDEIASAWTTIGLQTLRPVEVLSVEERKGWSARILEAMSDALVSGSYETAEAVVSERIRSFSALGIDIGTLLLCWMQGTAAALPVLRRAYPTDPDLVLECTAHLNQWLNYCTAMVSEHYAAESKKHLVQQQAQTQRILDAARAVSSTLELDKVLAYAARSIAQALGVPVCVVLALDEGREPLLLQHTDVIGVFRDDTRAGQGATDDASLVEEMLGFSLQMQGHKEPIVFHATDHDRSAHLPADDLCGARSVLGLPFVLNNRVVAVACVGAFEDAHTFSPEAIGLAQGIADVAALGIDNARLYRRVKEQAMVEERGRLSRELHDSLSQALGLLKIKSALAAEFLAGRHLDRVELSLDEMHYIATEAYTDAREAIFNLRSMEFGDVEFTAIVQRYLDQYRSAFGVHVELVLDEKDRIVLGPQASVQVLRIIQEALSNVRKHAQACRSVRVMIDSSDGAVRVHIEDDGQGFDLAEVRAEQTSRVGLAVMQERAESIGGHVTIDSAPGRGTRVTVCVPQAY